MQCDRGLRRRAVARVTACLLAAAAVFGQSVAPAAPRPVARTLTPTSGGFDWLTYGNSTQRTGENTLESALGSNTVGTLNQHWSHDLGAVVDTSPVLASGVVTPTGTQDLVFAGSEHGDFVALNAQTGTLVWTRNLGSVTSVCPDLPDHIFGISAAGAIDRSTDRIYVAGGDGGLYALTLGTGSIVSGWPVLLTADPVHEHDWGAVALNGNEAYAVLASPCGASPPLRGRVIGVNTVQHRINATFFSNGKTGPYGGGVWGWGGVFIDPSGSGTVYIATGDALAHPENVHHSDAVVELTGRLALVASNKPALGVKDADFGSTPVPIQASGCAPQLVVLNKNGEVFVYDRTNIAAGPVQTIAISYDTLTGVAAWSAAIDTLFVVTAANRAKFNHGMHAFTESAPACTLTQKWQTMVGPKGKATSPPTVADGVVYYGDGIGNTLHAFDVATGTELWNSGSAIAGPIFAAPIVVNGMVYAASWDHQLHAFGP